MPSGWRTRDEERDRNPVVDHLPHARELVPVGCANYA
jgi:hypothetical protein